MRARAAHPDQPDPMALDAVSGEFAVPATESQFLAHKLAQTRRLLASTLLFTAFFYACFAVTDFAALGFGPQFLLLACTRALVAATAGACAWCAWRRPLTAGGTRLAASIAEGVGFACFMVIVALRPDEMHWHAMSMAIMLVVIYLYIPNRLAYAFALALLATGGFLLLARQLAPMAHADAVTMDMLLVLANAFGALAARRYNLVSREEYRAHTELLHAAERDHLTGCYNRRYLHERLMGPELARAQRFGHSLTVVLCDIDNFKRINDTHGHGDGDAVLRSFAGLLRGMTRDRIDSVVRYGGEEFLAVLPETDLAGGVRLAERLRAAFASASTPSSSGDCAVATTASFGVACATFTKGSPRHTLRDLIATADQLLYDAKRAGRDRVRALQLP